MGGRWRQLPGRVLGGRGEVWISGNIVSRCDADTGALPQRRCLLNPANRSLAGTALPYVRRGGPLPAAAVGQRFESSRWGGMDAGEGNVYPVQSVDGQVHLKGGNALRARLDAHPTPLEYGDVVPTEAAGGLWDAGYTSILHAAVPFYAETADGLPCPSVVAALQRCYLHAVALASEGVGPDGDVMLSIPLIGAGTCGFPERVAAAAAARALSGAALQDHLRLRLVADTEAKAELWLAELVTHG
eukprot:TRINITY_DN15646_c0_g1_i1.p1 TRINITY_DN15646_c0_g1~~TRINITY_DN15646_c0_g1_i1.p1  ORF type:complete len:244 (+),score=2.11 TRINITY_DN15646_c0_g1_i1:402-1133(+)